MINLANGLKIIFPPPGISGLEISFLDSIRLLFKRKEEESLSKCRLFFVIVVSTGLVIIFSLSSYY